MRVFRRKRPEKPQIHKERINISLSARQRPPRKCLYYSGDRFSVSHPSSFPLPSPPYSIPILDLQRLSKKKGRRKRRKAIKLNSFEFLKLCVTSYTQDVELARHICSPCFAWLMPKLQVSLYITLSNQSFLKFPTFLPLRPGKMSHTLDSVLTL